MEMDIDMDIDLGPLEDGFPQLDNDPIAHSSQFQNGDIVTNAIIQSDKVHIRGLDDLTTDDIKAFSTEHYPQYPPLRVEWVDDTSANIVFQDSATASGALESFTLPSLDYSNFVQSVIHLREAKRLSTRSDVLLQVRTTLSSDKKRLRAHEASRFYMLHPEHDPRERRGHHQKERRQQYRSGEYRSRRYGYNEERRRRQIDHQEGFDPSMDDDDSKSSKQGSIDLSSDDPLKGGPVHPQRPAKSYEPGRDRSASPGKQRDGAATERRRTPPPPYNYRDLHPFPSENQGKELFPSRSNSGDLANKGKELFSNKMLAAGLKKELFPQKLNTVNHRRSDAFDAADETADLFANRLSIPLTEESQASRNLADRITKRSTTNGHGRAPNPAPEVSRQRNHDSGISILGASNQPDTGFSIRGGATAVGTITELFPGKALGNEGKELFAEKLPRRRNRAADMFH